MKLQSWGCCQNCMKVCFLDDVCAPFLYLLFLSLWIIGATCQNWINGNDSSSYKMSNTRYIINSILGNSKCRPELCSPLFTENLTSEKSHKWTKWRPSFMIQMKTPSLSHLMKGNTHMMSYHSTIFSTFSSVKTGLMLKKMSTVASEGQRGKIYPQGKGEMEWESA